MAGQKADPEMLRKSGSRLAELREHKEMSLADLAEVVGLSRGYLGDIESGRKRLAPELAVKLASALEVKLKDLDGPCPYCAGSGKNLHYAPVAD